MKLTKKIIEKYIEDARDALSNFKKEMLLTKKEGIRAIGQHGNFGEDAEILGIKMVGTIEINPPDLKLTEVFDRPSYEIDMKFKIMLHIHYRYNHLSGTLKVHPNEIRIVTLHQDIWFLDHNNINGCPCYFKFFKKEDFNKFRKILKSFYSQLGLRQKSIFVQKRIF